MMGRELVPWKVKGIRHELVRVVCLVVTLLLAKSQSFQLRLMTYVKLLALLLPFPALVEQVLLRVPLVKVPWDLLLSNFDHFRRHVGHMCVLQFF